MGKIKQEYMQRLDEEYLDWKHRLIIGKSEKKVDLSWKEISELLGLGGSTEYLRKVAYGIVEYRNWNIEKKLSAEDESDVFTGEKNLISYENTLYSIENGENPTKWNGTAHTAEEVTGWLNRELELIEVALDKEGFYLNCLDDLGGVAFSQSNVEIGYLVVLDRWGLVEVVGRGSKNITYPHNESSLYVDTLYIENIPNKKSFVHYMDFNNK